MSQEVLAGLVGRTVDWLSKVENGRIEIDRLSVIRAVAEALDVAMGDLLGDPTLLDWSAESGHRTVAALRETLLDYRQISPFLAATPTTEIPTSASYTRRWRRSGMPTRHHATATSSPSYLD